ncbi:MAG: hypothetical protein AAF756_10075 [Pseudomonadota bacterium]
MINPDGMSVAVTLKERHASCLLSRADIGARTDPQQGGTRLLGYWIVAIVVLIALAPLWQFMPSKRQRRLAQLRESAALQGLFVEFRDCPLPAFVQRDGRELIYYGVRLKPSRSTPLSTKVWARHGADWVSQPAREPVPPICAQLSDSWLAVGVSEGSCGGFWDESGDVDEVEKVAALLHSWKESAQVSDPGALDPRQS